MLNFLNSRICMVYCIYGLTVVNLLANDSVYLSLMCVVNADPTYNCYI